LEFREGAFDFQTSQQNQPKIKKRDEPITFMIINRVFYI